jgi:hypothetical protein
MNPTHLITFLLVFACLPSVPLFLMEGSEGAEQVLEWNKYQVNLKGADQQTCGLLGFNLVPSEPIKANQFNELPSQALKEMVLRTVIYKASATCKFYLSSLGSVTEEDWTTIKLFGPSWKDLGKNTNEQQPDPFGGVEVDMDKSSQFAIHIDNVKRSSQDYHVSNTYFFGELLVEKTYAPAVDYDYKIVLQGTPVDSLEPEMTAGGSAKNIPILNATHICKIRPSMKGYLVGFGLLSLAAIVGYYGIVKRCLRS